MLTHSPTPARHKHFTHDPIDLSSQSFGADWTASIASVRNARADCWKPNEDRIELDSDRQFVVIADGITRTKNADGAYPFPSPSAQVAQLFCNRIAELVRALPSISAESLGLALTIANRGIARFNQTRFPSVDFSRNDPAGVACILGVVDKNRLWVASIADCFCLVSDSLCTRQVAWERTSHATAEYNRLGETEARRLLRNNAKSKYGYGAFTGEEAALQFVQYHCIDLQYVQRIVFASDGLLQLATHSAVSFGTNSADELVRSACRLDDELGNTDDKTIVVLDRAKHHIGKS
jgi:hypothetical protein